MAAACRAGLDAGGDPVAFTRGLARASRDADELRRWLADDRTDHDVALDPQLRWRVVHRLAGLGGLDAEAIEDERRRDGTANGDLGAATALASRPTAEAKAEAWSPLTEDDDLQPSVRRDRRGAVAGRAGRPRRAVPPPLPRGRTAAGRPRAGVLRRWSGMRSRGSTSTRRSSQLVREALAGDVPTVLRREWEDALDDRAPSHQIAVACGNAFNADRVGPCSAGSRHPLAVPAPAEAPACSGSDPAKRSRRRARRSRSPATRPGHHRRGRQQRLPRRRMHHHRRPPSHQGRQRPPAHPGRRPDAQGKAIWVVAGDDTRSSTSRCPALAFPTATGRDGVVGPPPRRAGGCPPAAPRARPSLAGCSADDPPSPSRRSRRARPSRPRRRPPLPPPSPRRPTPSPDTRARHRAAAVARHPAAAAAAGRLRRGPADAARARPAPVHAAGHPRAAARRPASPR